MGVANSEGPSREGRAELAAALSHELRNPLNAIVCAASLIEVLGEVPPDIKPQIDVILRQARRLAKLLEEGRGLMPSTVPPAPPSRVVSVEGRLESGVISFQRNRPKARRVVIVEDDSDGCAMLSELLRREGYEVECATEGVRGLQLINDTVPSVAILDIDLPGLTGYEIARRVRADVPVPTVRLIALTARATSADRGAALEAGFDEHLVKPVTLAKLKWAIELSGQGTATAMQDGGDALPMRLPADQPLGPRRVQ